MLIQTKGISEWRVIFYKTQDPIKKYQAQKKMHQLIQQEVQRARSQNELSALMLRFGHIPVIGSCIKKKENKLTSPALL